MNLPSDYLFTPKCREGKTVKEALPLVFEKFLCKQVWHSSPANFRLRGDKDWYRDIYLKSDHWRVLRMKVLKRAAGYCEGCGRIAYEAGQLTPEVGGEIPLHIHHKTYERLGFELLEDLEALCQNCHKKRHSIAVIT